MLNAQFIEAQDIYFYMLMSTIFKYFKGAIKNKEKNVFFIFIRYKIEITYILSF